MSNCCSLPERQDKAPAVMACSVSGTRAKQVDSLTVKSLVRHLPFALPRTQYPKQAGPCARSLMCAETSRGRARKAHTTQ